MANPILNLSQQKTAKILIENLRKRIAKIADGDSDLIFAYRRKIYKELMHDERSKPSMRKRLKKIKWNEQKGHCAFCKKSLRELYSELDRRDAKAGYTKENTRLVHHDCHVKQQQTKHYR